MYENDKYDEITYYTIIIPLFIILIPILIYFSVILYYLKQNYKKDITILWIDYLITASFGIIFFIIYLITIMVNKSKKINYFNEISSNKSYILSNTFLLFYFYSIINNIIFDILKSFELSYKIVKITNIIDTELDKIIPKYKEIELMNMIKRHRHYYFIIAINIFNFIIVSLFDIIYTNIKIQDEFCSIKQHNIYLLKNYYLFVLTVLIVSTSIINVYKKVLINNKYYASDKFVISIYNIYYNQIIYYIDILCFKVGIDLFVNIPLIFFISFSMSSSFALILFELSLLFFIIIGGNIQLIIDNKNKYKNKRYKNNILKLLFCFKDINVSDNGFNCFMKEYDYYINCSSEEKEILSKLNIYFIENNIIDKDNKEIYLNEVKEDYYEVREEEENSDDKDSNIDINSEFDIIAEYFIIYKLLYMFFDKNKDSYINLLKKVKKNGGAFIRQYSIETISSGKKSNKKRNKKADILNIEKVSRLSELESKNINPSLKCKKDDIFKTFQEKELLEEINKKYKKTEKSKINFIIEALSHSSLFEIFPFYNLKIEDILKSLNPSNNFKLFKQFIGNLNKSNNNESYKNSNYKNSANENEKSSINENEKNSSNENEKNSGNENEKNSGNENEKNSSNENDKKLNDKNIDSNLNKIIVNDDSKKGKDNTYNNESESENKSSESSQSNCYHTYNNLIMIEIYNKSDFIKFNEISELTHSFKDYTLNNVKEIKCTFLPLLIGIFNIKFLGKDKIVIIYRNPLYFSNFSRFNNWIHFYISEAAEKSKKPIVTKNDIIDIDEIEIKDNIKLSESDYEEIKKILDNDFSYLKKLNFEVFPIIHLFIGDDNTWEEKMKKNHVMSESFVIGSLGSQHSLSVLLNSSSEGYNSFNNSLKKKDSIASDYNSFLEKEYYTLSGNKDVHTIKIYFTNYFRLGNKINKEEGKTFIFNSDTYRTFLKSKLMSYLTKNSLFSSDEKDSDNEKRKSSITMKSPKSNEEEKIIIKSGDS